MIVFFIESEQVFLLGKIFLGNLTDLPLRYFCVTILFFFTKKVFN